MARVSVIVPVFKVEQYLRNCVDHLCDQTLQDIEIILVDDGSPDTCPQICDYYADKDNRVRVIHKKNGGVSAARNDGLKIATGDYIIFCDSDDWMEETGLENLYNAAVESDADMTIGDVYLAYNDRTKYVKFYRDEFITSDHSYIVELIKADIYRTYCPNPPDEGCAFGYGGPWNKLIRRRFLIENEINFDLRLKGIFDDILYTAHVLAKVKCVRYIQKPVYFYRQVEGSITHTYKPNVIEINEAIFTAWEELFSTLDNPEQYREAYYACVLRRTEEAIKLYFNNPKNTKVKKESETEFEKIMRKEPYSTAIGSVKMRKLSKKQMTIALLLRAKAYSLAMRIM